MASKAKKQRSAAALKKDATPGVFCPICDESIVDSSIKNAGHDSIFCEGACKAWLHRGCAGLVKIAFEEVSKSKDKFFCPHCKLVNHESEILSLRASLSSLSNELSSIKTLVASLSSRDNQPPIQNKPEAPAIISDDNAPQLQSNSVSHKLSNQPCKVSFIPLQDLHSIADRRYNVVLFGVEECSTGASRSDRLSSDLNNVVSVLSEVDHTIQPLSIKDCFRLGKFKPSLHRPRPILVKLVRTTDVSSILSKRGTMSHPFFVKPDLSPEERLRDSILLKERWKLIEAGTMRKEIKIRKNCLYVKGTLYGKLINSNFQLSTPSHDQCSIQSPLHSSHVDSSPTDRANAITGNSQVSTPAPIEVEALVEQNQSD